MIWVLLLIAGGNSHYSGISMDLSQRFSTEERCIEMRDQFREITARNSGSSGHLSKHLVSAECVRRVASTSAEK